MEIIWQSVWMILTHNKLSRVLLRVSFPAPAARWFVKDAIFQFAQSVLCPSRLGCPTHLPVSPQISPVFLSFLKSYFPWQLKWQLSFASLFNYRGGAVILLVKIKAFWYIFLPPPSPWPCCCGPISTAREMHCGNRSLGASLVIVWRREQRQTDEGGHCVMFKPLKSETECYDIWRNMKGMFGFWSTHIADVFLGKTLHQPCLLKCYSVLDYFLFTEPNITAVASLGDRETVVVRILKIGPWIHDLFRG